MIGQLPQELNVNGKIYKIRTDYRIILNIFEAFEDPELTEKEKLLVMVRCLYIDSIPGDDFEEAITQANWFLNCGNSVGRPQSSKPLYSWEQDEQMMFSAINKVAGKEVRAVDYMHFWTFISLFNEIGEGIFSTVVSIRNKRQKGKKLEKWEQEFFNKNKELILLNKKHTLEEQEQLNALDEILGVRKE